MRRRRLPGHPRSHLPSQPCGLPAVTERVDLSNLPDELKERVQFARDWWDDVGAQPVPWDVGDTQPCLDQREEPREDEVKVHALGLPRGPTHCRFRRPGTGSP